MSKRERERGGVEKHRVVESLLLDLGHKGQIEVEVTLVAIGPSEHPLLNKALNRIILRVLILRGPGDAWAPAQVPAGGRAVVNPFTS